MFASIKNLFTGEASHLQKDERGITALETAIILIAFVVVAAVFAFTVLSAGTVSTEKGKEAVFAGLAEVSSSMELRGSVIATATVTGTSGTVGALVFTVGQVSGGEAQDLTDTSSGNNKVVVDYRDGDQVVTGVDWSVSWSVRHDTDDMLEDGELAQITVDLTGLTTDLGPDTSFAVEVKPPRGGVIILEKTTPSYIDPVMTLN
jgi:flagellin FlaB